MERIVDFCILDKTLLENSGKRIELGSLASSDEDFSLRQFLIVNHSQSDQVIIKVKYCPHASGISGYFIPLTGRLSLIYGNGVCCSTLNRGYVELQNDYHCFVWKTCHQWSGFVELLNDTRVTLMSEICGISEYGRWSLKQKDSVESNSPLKNSFSDFAILVDENAIECHKSVLTAHSDVFHAMFHGNYREKEENQMRINEFRYDTVEAMVKFLYHHQIDNIRDLALELLILSDKYNIIDLTEFCENYVSSKISLENFFLIYQVATYCNSPILKENLRRFLSTNHALLLERLAAETN